MPSLARRANDRGLPSRSPRLVALLVTAAQLPAQQPAEPLVVQVKHAIASGVKYLQSRQRPDGSYEIDQVKEGGETGLAVVALLVSGVPADDPSLTKALKYLRELKSDQTYIVSLQAMALAEAKCPDRDDMERLQRHVNWLLKARVLNGNRLEGWNYSNRGPEFTDGSNTQYALLALWSARQAGVKIPPIVWEEIRSMYLSTQSKIDGTWRYSYGPLGSLLNETMTMTTAGVNGLLIAGSELNAGREVFTGPADAAKGCGEYEDNKAVEKGIGWIKNNFVVSTGSKLPRTFYHLYGLERTGRLTGQRFFGEHDWYREGSKFLVRQQHPDGSWWHNEPAGGWDRWPIVSTSFALMFLSKGKTPVLISKLVHGTWPRVPFDNDWNNDHNDLKNLVAHASKEIFHRQPLAWQTVDLMMAAQPPGKRNLPTDDDLAAVTAELLQSPILYITGHRSPKRRFTAIEKKLLKKYVDNGGFIVAEACCSSLAFDAGFKDLVADIWPNADFSPLAAEHAIWTSPTTVAPGQPYTLWGLNEGCKTILIYSPQDLSCRWESGKIDDPRCIQAFRLGLNIIAYATGMQPPQERLTEVAVQRERSDPPTIPRGALKVAQLRYNGDWHPAPRAMRNLMEDLHDVAGLDVVLKTEERPIGDPGIVDFKFVYMHGRSKFDVDKDDLKDLRFSLKSGGLLFADACCGKEAFDGSFRKFVAELLPGMKLEPVPATDPLFAKGLGGEALTAATIKGRTTVGGELKGMAPYLEGIRYEGRWVVLYSKYDIGCALEKHQSPDCRGYDPDSAKKIARAAALYALAP